MKDKIGTRIKQYEKEWDLKLNNSPSVVRIDGKNFSKFTSKFEKPFDIILHNAMIAGTKKVIEETNALIGYTQSDEASFVYELPTLFGGKKVK